MPSCALDGSSRPADDLLAEQRGARVHAEVDRAVLRQLHLDAAVLRNAPLRDVEPRHDLETRRDLHRQRDRRPRDLGEHAVLPQPNAEVLLVRLEVDVRGAALDRVEHHLVDEAHDRRVVDVGAADLGADILVARGDLEVLEVEVAVVVEVRHRGVDGLDGARDARVELVLLDDDGFDAQRRLELDVVESLEVGRIADRDVEPLAALQQRQDPVLRQQLLVDELDDVEVEVDGVQVEQRDAELVSGRDRDLPRVAEPVRHEVRDEMRALAADRLERGHEVTLGNDAVLHEPTRQAGQRTLGCGNRHGFRACDSGQLLQ